MNNYYVYRHFKKNTNIVFYIGLGHQPKYLRAKTKFGRNRFWKATVEKYDFDFEIIQDNISFEEAEELEIFLISLYGRRDLEKGLLTNLTDGGGGTKNMIKTEEGIRRWKKSNLGKQDGEKNVMFGKVRGKHHLAKEVLNLETGIFYDCALDACENLPMSYSGFKGKLNRKINNDTSYIYAEDYEKGLLPFKKEHPNHKKVINIKTKEIFESIFSASKTISLSSQTLGHKLNKSNDTDFQYLDDYNKGVEKIDKKRGWMKYLLDTQTGVFYNSLSEATKYYPYTYSHMKQMLNTKSPCKNKTSLIYV